MSFFGSRNGAAPTVDALGQVDTVTAHAWHRSGSCLFIDIREDNEFAAGHIPGAVTAPLSRFDQALPAEREGKKAVFYCLSGMRTRANAQRLAAAGFADAYILDGGLNAWKAIGAPTE